MSWYKYGWGKDFSPDYNPKLQYYINLAQVRPHNEPLVAVAYRSIQHITENYPGPYYLMLSGGIDSQLMYWCWQSSGAKFIPVSFRYRHENTYFNDHDLVQLEKFSSYIRNI